MHPCSFRACIQVDQTQTPAERFGAQLQQMRDMGFYDETANIRALTATNGNVSAAVERVLSEFGAL